MAISIEPGSRVEAVALDHQRVSIPASHRVPHPRRVGLTLERAPVHPDLPISEIRIEHHDQRRCLDNAHHLRTRAVPGGGVGRPERQAADLHPVLAEILAALFDGRACPRKDLRRVQIGGDVSCVLRRRLHPQSGEIRPVVRRPRRRRDRIRLAVGRAWNPWSRLREPLRRGRSGRDDDGEDGDSTGFHRHTLSIRRADVTASSPRPRADCATNHASLRTPSAASQATSVSL